MLRFMHIEKRSNAKGHKVKMMQMQIQQKQHPISLLHPCEIKMYLIHHVGTENKLSIYVAEIMGDGLGPSFVVTPMCNKTISNK